VVRKVKGEWESY